MGSIRCYLEQLHFNLFGLRSLTLFYKRTNIAAFPRPFPKKGAVSRVVFGKKRPNTSVRLSLLKSLLNKKSFRKSEKSYEKMSLDHITVKTMDEYETGETDNSDSPSENKRTEFTNTRHINPELKILMHSQQQLRSKISYGVLKTINCSEWASPMFTV
jgi:hypothetical protein